MKSIYRDDALLGMLTRGASVDREAHDLIGVINIAFCKEGNRIVVAAYPTDKKEHPDAEQITEWSGKIIKLIAQELTAKGISPNIETNL